MAFDKLKQLNELRKMRGEAMEMQKKLKTVFESLEKGKYRVKVTGDQRIDFLSIDGESQPELVKVINEALEKVQKTAAKKMLEEGGLSGLLKGF